MQCQIDRDAEKGLPPVDYSSDDLEFVCGPCKRNPKRVPNRGQPPPRRSAAQQQQQQQYVPQVQQAKAGAKKAAATPPPKKAAPPPKKAAAQAAKPPLKGRKSSTGAGQQHGNGNGYGSPASGSQTPTGLPGAGQPPLDYESLKRLIQERPVLVNQLPPTYQDHFRQVLGIPVPYPM